MDWSYVAGYFDGEGCVLFRAPARRPDYKITGLQWANTHRESLVAMQRFMGCGRLTSARTRPGCRDIYTLSVLRCDDVVRVGESMLPHLIIKRDKFADMIAFVREHRKPHGFALKKLRALGADAVRQMYLAERLSRKTIGQRLGIARYVVSKFMKEHGIEGRLRAGVKRGYKRTTPRAPRAAQFRGSHHHRAKLTEESVIAIRTAYAQGTTTTAQLVKDYGVCRETIINVVQRRDWTHV